MGYLAGRVATEALLSIKGDITKESVNAAFKAVKNFNSDLWCKPWYFDSTVGQNVSNNNDITVTSEGRQHGARRRTASPSPSCRPTRSQQIRAKEKSLGLNAGHGPRDQGARAPASMTTSSRSSCSAWRSAGCSPCRGWASSSCTAPPAS